MKKLLLLLALFLIQIVTAQENITLDDLLRNGNPNRPTTPIIYQRSVGIAGLPNFNTKINTANHKYFEQAIAELFSASNKQLFINYTTLRAYVAEYEEIPNLVSVGIINAQYDLLNYDMRNPSNPNNGFRFTGNKLIAIKGKQEFIKMHTTVISPLKKYVIGSTVLFKFDESLIFSYGTKRINTLSADLGDGVFRTVISDGNIVLSKINISITRSKELKQIYKVIFSDNTTLITYSTIYAKNPNQSLRRKSASISTLDSTLTSDYAFRGYDEPQALNGVLDYRVFYADANTSRRLRKPIIILDGFDPGDERQIEETDYMIPNSDDNKPSIYELMDYGKSPNDQNLVKNLKTKGYDVVIVNFPSYKVVKPWIPAHIPFYIIPRRERYVDGGADYIERNALTVVTLLQNLNREIRGNGSTEKLVVMGPSMGGLISRYALAYMEKELAKNPTNTAHKQKWDHNTRLWISMDSPLGANIPIGVQALLYLMKEANKVAAADYYNYRLKSPAAQQMLINQHKKGRTHHHINNSYMNGRVTEQGFSTNSGAPFYQRFYRALYNNGLPNSKGYPINVDRKIAIVNGSMAGITIGSNSQQTINVRGFLQVYILGFRIGSAHSFSSETYTLPYRGVNASRIARLKKSFNDKTTIASSYDTRGNLDILSGGTNDTYDQIVKSISGRGENTGTVLYRFFSLLDSFYAWLTEDDLLTFSERTNTRIHGFIPTFSALAIKNPDRRWSGGINESLVCNNRTPFDTYYGESTNTRHVSFTQSSKDWLFNELDGINQLPVPNTSGNTLRTKSALCGNKLITYTLDPCDSYEANSWSVSYNPQIISFSPRSITVKTNITGTTVNASITANLKGGKVITKRLNINQSPTLSFNNTSLRDSILAGATPSNYPRVTIRSGNRIPVNVQYVNRMEWKNTVERTAYPTYATERDIPFTPCYGSAGSIEDNIDIVNIQNRLDSIESINYNFVTIGIPDLPQPPDGLYRPLPDGIDQPSDASPIISFSGSGLLKVEVKVTNECGCHTETNVYNAGTSSYRSKTKAKTLIKPHFDLSLFPNPANSSVTIRVPNDSSEILDHTITLTNINTNIVVYSNTFTIAAGQGRSIVLSTSYPQGIYIVTIISKYGKTSKKLIIANH